MEDPTEPAASMNHYETLGVARDATYLEIKRAYHRLARKHHPDKGGDVEKMAAINAAWECLSDTERRARYDETGQDKRETSLNDAAQGHLMQVFNQILDEARVNDNLLGSVRQRLNTQVLENTQSLALIAQARNALNKARGRICKKGKGSNIYHLLIDQRLSVLDKGETEANESIEEYRLALKMLEEYQEESTVRKGGLFELAREVLETGKTIKTTL